MGDGVGLGEFPAIGFGEKKVRTYLYQFNCVSTASPAVNWGARNAMAWPGVMSPRARGRVLVRSMFVWCVSKCIEYPERRTDGVVQVPIPQVVDRASSAAHYQSAGSEQGDVCQRDGRWRVERI